MNKRQKKKEQIKLFKEMSYGIPVYDFEKKHKELKKVSMKEDLNILFAVMDNEFDDSPHRKFLAEHILYDYAWWFILEKYLEEKKIEYVKTKNDHSTTYEFSGNIISVDQKGKKTCETKDYIGEKTLMMLRQKGY